MVLKNVLVYSKIDHHKRGELAAESLWLCVSLCDFSLPNTPFAMMISAMSKYSQEQWGTKRWGHPTLDF